MIDGKPAIPFQTGAVVVNLPFRALGAVSRHLRIGCMESLAPYIDAFSTWLTVEKAYSPHTVDGYCRDLHDFAAFLGEKDGVEGIDARSIRAYVFRLNSRHKSSSVARKLSALRTFFRFLIKREVIARDPVAGVSSPKQGRYIPAFLSVDEVFSLLETPGRDDPFAARDRAILELLYSTGMRVAELVGLDMVNQIGRASCRERV